MTLLPLLFESIWHFETLLINWIKFIQQGFIKRWLVEFLSNFQCFMIQSYSTHEIGWSGISANRKNSPFLFKQKFLKIQLASTHQKWHAHIDSPFGKPAFHYIFQTKRVQHCFWKKFFCIWSMCSLVMKISSCVRFLYLQQLTPFNDTVGAERTVGWELEKAAGSDQTIPLKVFGAREATQ